MLADDVGRAGSEFDRLVSPQDQFGVRLADGEGEHTSIVIGVIGDTDERGWGQMAIAFRRATLYSPLVFFSV